MMITNLTAVTLSMVALGKPRTSDVTISFVAVIIGAVLMVKRTGAIISGANCRIHIRLEW
jgi:hypothetical protein